MGGVRIWEERKYTRFSKSRYTYGGQGRSLGDLPIQQITPQNGDVVWKPIHHATKWRYSLEAYSSRHTTAISR